MSTANKDKQLILKGTYLLVGESAFSDSTGFFAGNCFFTKYCWTNLHND